MGVPCTVWSIARRGIKNWARALQKEEISIALTLFMVRVYRECVRCGVPVSVENPRSSKLWQFHLVRDLMSLPNSRFVTFDMCRYGSEYRKPTALLTTLSELEVLGKRCNHAYRHVPAAGSTRVRVGSAYKWVARTTLAGAYPAQLCSTWARLVRGASSFAATGGPRDASQSAARFQAELESCVRRRSSSKGHRAPAATAIEQQLGGDDYAMGASSNLFGGAQIPRDPHSHFRRFRRDSVWWRKRVELGPTASRCDVLEQQLRSMAAPFFVMPQCLRRR